MEIDSTEDDVTKFERRLQWAWLTASVIWAIAFLANGATQYHRIAAEDCCIASAPFVFSLLIRRLCGARV